MMWKVMTKYWTENSIGEQTEGPWVPRGTFGTKEEAETVAAEYREWNATSGCWASVEEVEA